MNLWRDPTVILAIAALIAAIYRFANRDSDIEPDPAWLASFSMEIYLTIPNMLDERDCGFLAQSNKAAARSFRAARAKAFQRCLSELRRDYYQLRTFCRLAESNLEKPWYLHPQFLVAMLYLRLSGFLFALNLPQPMQYGIMLKIVIANTQTNLDITAASFSTC